MTAAVGVGPSTVEDAYNVKEMSKHLDFINLMTYDLHGSWEPNTGHHAAFTADDELNIEWAVNNWLNKGAPANKLVLGMATYGRSFTLESSSNFAIGAPAAGAGTPGDFTKEKGFISYYEVLDLIKSGAKQHWDSTQQVPYIHKGKQWIGYDNKKSLKIKTDFIKEKKLLGGMVWAMDLDDFQHGYPLIASIADDLNI